MTKIYITINGKYDYFVIPHVMATKLTKYDWVVVNQSVLPEPGEWGISPRSLKMPEIPTNASENDIKSIIANTFGEIVAERENGEDDQGWIALNPEKWEKLIDRHGIPDF
jgi:hypothetical protein